MHGGDSGDDLVAAIGLVALRQVACEAERDLGLDAEETLRRSREASRCRDYREDRGIGRLGVRSGRAGLPALNGTDALRHRILDGVSLGLVARPAIGGKLGEPLAQFAG